MDFGDHDAAHWQVLGRWSNIQFLVRGHIHGIVSIHRCNSRSGACNRVLKAILEAGVVVVHLRF